MAEIQATVAHRAVFPLPGSARAAARLDASPVPRVVVELA